MSDNTRIPLPTKLSRDMSWKCWDNHTEAFKSLVDAVSVVCPGIALRSTQRYSAFYRDSSIVAYVDPQRRRILLGFFRDWVHRIKHQITITPTGFPDWNGSKGGLIGYEILGQDRDLTRRVADVAYLVIESYRRS